jgi:hypothetical protein
MESLFLWKIRKTKKGTPLPTTPRRRSRAPYAFERSHQLIVKKLRGGEWCRRWLIFWRRIWPQRIPWKEEKKSRAFACQKVPNYQKGHRRRPLPLPRWNLQNRASRRLNLAQLWNHNHCDFYARHCQHLRLHVVLQHFVCRGKTPT